MSDRKCQMSHTGFGYISQISHTIELAHIKKLDRRLEGATKQIAMVQRQCSMCYIKLILATQYRNLMLAIWRVWIVWVVQQQHERYIDQQQDMDSMLLLKHILSRLMKDELVMRLEIWRSRMQEEMRAIEMGRLKAELGVKATMAARAVIDGKGAGLRQLKQIMVRMMKGEAVIRLEIWRRATEKTRQQRIREAI